MSTFAPLGPKKPIKKPKPAYVETDNGDIVFYDNEDGFAEGSEVFVCTDEVSGNMELLETCTFTTTNDLSVQVDDGVIISIS